MDYIPTINNVHVTRALVILMAGIFVHTGDAFQIFYPSTPHCTEDSRIVNTCLNMYLERDVEDIMGIIYPGHSSRRSVCSPDGYIPTLQGDRTVITDIPSFVKQCERFWEVYRCLKKELDDCEGLTSFFNLRHVLYSMEKSILWVCGKSNSSSKSHPDSAHKEVQDRFSVLIRNVHCLECLRTSNRVIGKCYNGNNTLAGDSHIWAQILRLQHGPEICSELQKQLDCFWEQNPIVTCKGNGTHVYKSVTTIFINAWCDEHPFRQFVSDSRQQYLQYATLTGLLLVLLL